MEELLVEPRAADQRTWFPTQEEPQAASSARQPQLHELPSPEPPQPMGPPQQQQPPTTPATPLPQAATSAMAFPAVRPLPPWHQRPNAPATAHQPPATAAPTLVSWMQAVARATISASQLATALANRPAATPDELARLAEANATEAWQVHVQTDSAVNQMAYLTAPKQAPLPPPPQQHTLTAEQAQFIRMWERCRSENQEKPKKKRKKNRTGHHSPATYRIDSTEEADLHGDDSTKVKSTKRKYRGDA